MKKYFASMMMTLAIATASAQNAQEAQQQQRPQLTEQQRMEMRSQKAAHKMGLSDEQTKKFTDIYADYQKEMKGVMEKYPMRSGGKKDLKDKKAPKDGKDLKDKKDGKDLKDKKDRQPQARKGGRGPQGWQPKDMSDQELEQMHKNHFARSRAMLDVQEKYYKKLRTVLTERQYEQLMNMQKKGWGKAKRQKAMRGKNMRGKNMRGMAMRGQNMRGKAMQGKDQQGSAHRFQGKEMKAERQ